MQQASVMKIKNNLEIASSVMILLIGAIVIGVVIWNLFFPRQMSTFTKPTTRPELTKGQTLANIPGIDFKKSPKTLLVAMNTTCVHCQESVPFVNDLAKTSGSGTQEVSAAGVQIVGVFPNSANDVREFAEQRHLQIQTIAGVPLNGLTVTATPTMILVDNSGKVLDFWIGTIPEKMQPEVLRQISG